MYVQIEIVWSMIQDDPTTINERTNAVGRTVMRGTRLFLARHTGCICLRLRGVEAHARRPQMPQDVRQAHAPG